MTDKLVADRSTDRSESAWKEMVPVQQVDDVKRKKASSEYESFGRYYVACGLLKLLMEHFGSWH